MLNNNQIRLKDVADIAGVSVGTVDRVIHERGEVAAQTREKVLSAIKELDYTPNLIARSLALKKVFRFAALIPESSNENDYWYGPLKGIEGAEEELKAYKLHVEKHFFAPADPETFLDKAIEILKSQPDGLMFSPLYADNSIFLAEECRRAGIPYVVIDSNIDDDGKISFIGQNSFRSGALVGKLLSRLTRGGGTILVALLGVESKQLSQVGRRIAGFMDYFKQFDPGSKDRVKTASFISRNGADYSASLSAYFDENDVSGVFIPNSRAYLLCEAMSSERLKNTCVIGYDLLFKNLRYLEDELIDFLIAQNPREQGYRAIMDLFDHVALKKRVRKETYIPIDIITRENYEFYINH